MAKRGMNWFGPPTVGSMPRSRRDGIESASPVLPSAHQTASKVESFAPLNIEPVHQPFLAQLIQLHLQFFLVPLELLLLDARVTPQLLCLLAQFLLPPTEILAKLPNRCANIFGGKFHLWLQLGNFLPHLAQLDGGIRIEQRALKTFLLLQKFSGFLALGKSQIQVPFFLVANYTHADRRAVARLHRVHEIACVMHRLVVYLDDHVSGVEA